MPYEELIPTFLLDTGLAEINSVPRKAEFHLKVLRSCWRDLCLIENIAVGSRALSAAFTISNTKHWLDNKEVIL